MICADNQKQPPEVFCKKSVLKKLRKFHRKTPVWKSLFNKFAGLQPCIFIKKETPTQVFSCEICETFTNTYFEEHLRTTASGQLRSVR